MIRLKNNLHVYVKIERNARLLGGHRIPPPKIKLTHSGKSVTDTPDHHHTYSVLVKALSSCHTVTQRGTCTSANNNNKKPRHPGFSLIHTLPCRPFPHPFHLRRVEIHRSEGLGLGLRLATLGMGYKAHMMTTEKGVYVLGWMGDDDLGDLCYFFGKGRFGGMEVGR